MEIFLVTITILVCLIGSYLIGNILFAQVISKVYFKKNIRSEGSKNPGATNLVRITKNRYIGILASFLDAAKGYVSILIGSYTLGLLLKKTNMEYLDPFILFCGTFSVLGHCFPIMYVIKYCKGVRGDELKQVSGGKGVSTYGGTVFSISPYIGLISLST
jgi:glycerol-3-phosphate acyltransferase PlsY